MCETKPESFWHINRVLLYPKAYYFLFFAGLGSFWPFAGVYAKQLGINEVQVGLLFTVSSIAGFSVTPLVGALADKYKIRRKLFVVFNILNLLALTSFALLRSPEPTRSVSLDCSDGRYHVTQSSSQDKGPGKCGGSSEVTTESTNRTDTCRLSCLIIEESRDLVCEGSLKPAFSEYCSNQPKDHAFLSLELKGKTSIPPAAGQLMLEVQNSSFPKCSNNVSLNTCSLYCDSNEELDRRLQKLPEGRDSNGVFWGYVTIALINCLVVAIVVSVGDVLCLHTLGENSHLYGRQRQWGTIGWGLFTFIAGSLVDWNSQGSVMKNYTTCFILVFVMLSLCSFTSYKWKVKETTSEKTELKTELKALLLKPDITVFFVGCIAVGACNGLLANFLFWYVEDIASCDDMRYIKTLQGLIIVVQCFGGELPLFYISSWFIKKFGHINCMSMVFLAFGLRFVAYSFLTRPWHILPVELLHGFTFGIFYSNMASYAYDISSADSSTTVQGIFRAGYEGIGVGAGSLSGGILYKMLSGRVAFRSYGIASLIACVIFHVSMWLLRRRKSTYTPGTEASQIEAKPQTDVSEL